MQIYDEKCWVYTSVRCCDALVFFLSLSLLACISSRSPADDAMSISLMNFHFFLTPQLSRRVVVRWLASSWHGTFVHEINRASSREWNSICNFLSRWTVHVARVRLQVPSWHRRRRKFHVKIFLQHTISNMFSFALSANRWILLWKCSRNEKNKTKCEMLW